MKNILVVSNCSKRGSSTGLTGKFLEQLSDIDRKEYSISLLDLSFSKSSKTQSNYPVECHYKLPKGIISSIISRIPKIRALYSSKVAKKAFQVILKQRTFDGVILYQVQPNADEWVRIAHENNTKIMFFPWGSEILRASNDVKIHLQHAFSEVDYVIGAQDANTLIYAKEVFNVPDNRILQYKNYLKGVKLIKKIRGKLSRDEMLSSLKIPQSNNIILCGYNGYAGQRHKVIIDAISKCKDVLPDDYILVFPITYGASNEYIQELKNYCAQSKLNSYFITEYLSDEQVAYLHLVTDLFVQIQPTDDGNDFMKEALFAENRIVTGRWLKYLQFEKYGIPYYSIDTLEELPAVLYSIFTGEKQTLTIPLELINTMDSASEEDNKLFWRNLFSIL